MEITTSFCAAGGCVACGGCGSRAPSSDLPTGTKTSQTQTLTPDSAISTGPVLAVINTDQSMAWTGGVIGKPTVITYAFGNSSTLTVAESLGTQGDSHEFNAYQKAAWRVAMEMHSASSGVQLIEVSDASSANVVINYQTLSNYTGLGWVNFPGTVPQVHIEVNARYFEQFESMDFNLGGSDLPIFMLHELGHSLGMKHPYFGDVQLPSAFNNRGYTVMSHTANPDGTYRSDLSPLDRSALEFAYGAQADQEALPVQWYQLAGGGLISVGNEENNTIVGISDRDLVLAGSGNDTINAGSGNDTISAGAGTNYIYAGSGIDVLALHEFSYLDNNFKLIFTDKANASQEGRSGVFVADGVLNYFTGIDAFEFNDGKFILSDAPGYGSVSTTETLSRIYLISHGSAAPASWITQKVNSLAANRTTLEAITANELNKTDWISLRGDGLNEQSFSILWARAYGETMPNGEFNIAKLIMSDVGIVLELAIAANSDKFMQTSLEREYIREESAITTEVVERTEYHETLEAGEATYGFKIIDEKTVLSQRAAAEILNVTKGNASVSVELYDGRIIQLPVVDKIRLTDGVIDFRAGGLLTFTSRVFEALSGRDMASEELRQLSSATQSGSAGRIVAELLSDPAVSGRITGLSADGFARVAYRGLLGREPTDDEIRAVRSHLTAGETKTDFLIDFILSNSVVEHLSAAAEGGIFFENASDVWTLAAWDVIFNRPLLSPTRDNFSKALYNGGAIENSYLALFNSAEAKTRYEQFTDREFVGIIYQNAFGHPADDAFVNTALARIAAGAARATILGDIVREVVSQRGEQGWYNLGAVSLDIIVLDRFLVSSAVKLVQGNSWAEFINAGATSSGVIIDAGGGSDSVWGGAGADAISGGNGNDTIVSGAGNDTLDGGLGIDRLIGGAGDDFYIVAPGDVVIEALDRGADTLSASGGVSFTLPANVEVLLLDGGQPVNGIGNGLDNLIRGNGAANILYGLGGNDVLIGGGGNDILLGGGGNDSLNGGLGADRLVGGPGDDFYVATHNDVVVEALNQGSDTILASGGGSFALGNNFEVLLLDGDQPMNGIGNGLDNFVQGNGAENIIYGLGGADTLEGLGGNDILIGGGGRDILVGGLGSDQFRFASTSDSSTAAPDVISDFRFAGGQETDRIDLRLIDANEFAAGNQAFTYIDAANFDGHGAASAGQLRVQVQAIDSYVAEADVDGDGVADFALEISSNQIPTSEWFFL